LFRLLPEESSTIDARPLVGNTVTAYYGLTGARSTSVTNSAYGISGEDIMGSNGSS